MGPKGVRGCGEGEHAEALERGLPRVVCRDDLQLDLLELRSEGHRSRRHHHICIYIYNRI